MIFAVALRGYTRPYDMINDKSQQSHNGFERIRLAYYAYYDFICKYPHLALILNASNSLKSSSAAVDIPYRQKFMDFDKCLFEKLVSIFLDGKSDGSIRSDLDISQLAFSSIFVAVGFLQLFSLSGSTYTKHFGLDRDEFAKFTLDMLIDSIKNK